MTNFFNNRYYCINKFFLSCIGQWPFHSTRRNRFIRCFVFTALLICLITTGAGFFQVWGDPDKMIECLATIFTATGCLVYTIIYIMKENKLSQLFDKIKSDWKLWSSGEEQFIILNHANYGRIYTIFYTGSLVGTVVTYIIMTLTPQILDVVLPLNASRPKTLPFQINYFVNYSDEYFYWIMIHISFNCVLELSILIGSESILAVFTEHACGLFRIIGLQLKKMSSNDTEKKNLQAVIFCIEQHNRAIEFCNIVESLFCPCFFFIIGLNTIIISVSLIQLVLNLDKLDVVIRFGTFTGATIAHLFLNSFPGQRLLDYSVDLADNLYEGSWYQMPTKVRKLLLLIMLRSRKPCKITAGKMLVLSLSSVCSILQASFSYFTLISSVTS